MLLTVALINLCWSSLGITPELAATSRSLSLYTMYSGVCKNNFELLPGLVDFSSSTASLIGARLGVKGTEVTCEVSEDVLEVSVLSLIDKYIYSRKSSFFGTTVTALLHLHHYHLDLF